MTSVDEHGRTDMPTTGDELPMLLGFLDYQRATFAWKTRGLAEEGLRQRLQHPTAMTLGGMLKHLARVEDYWFGSVVAQQPTLAPWDGMEWSAEWESPHGDSAEDVYRLWHERVEHSRAVVKEALASPEALTSTYPAWGGQGQASLRWVLLHMVEEYARHNGHADLLREAVDGETGE